ncbi:MAG: hypothetical protein KAI66_18250 [Lentisphaeria bacterium]|nr:hypothetical protein [Lentisphaeria bacterium]
MPDLDRKREILRLHTHPDTGSEFWCNRLARLGLDWEDVLACPDAVPPVTVEELRSCGIEDFLPRPLRELRPYLITGETSGFSGQPVLACFTEEEFRSGFVRPFVEQAERVGFPLLVNWLWAGPSGPHIVGKALREILRVVGGTDPFAVDFDPRWFRKQARDSLSARRYFAHILSQIDDILSRQVVEVLYATPPVVKALAERMPEAIRTRILGVHYAGMAMSEQEYKRCRDAFPNAVHMSGYGNSLFGMFPETAFTAAGIEYATQSERVETRVVRMETDGAFADCAVGKRGRIMLSRYDHSMLILNMVLEDEAVRTECGILDPRRPQKQFEGKLLY